MKRDYNRTPGYLAVGLLTNGLKLEAGLSGVRANIVLPKGVWVSAPIKKEFTEKSPYTLKAKGHGFVIANSTGEVAVELVKEPSFYRRKAKSGALMSSLGRVYKKQAAINIDTPCGFRDGQWPCEACAPEFWAAAAEGKKLEDVLEFLEEAIRGERIEAVNLSTGRFSEEDGGLQYLTPFIKAIKLNLDLLVGIELHPPKDKELVDAAYAMGVDAVAYNLEIFDPRFLRSVLPGRSKTITRERYLNTLRYAASIFPKGAVVSDLVIGLEPLESSLKGIELLASIGVIPTLVVLSPQQRAQLIDFHLLSLTSEDLLKAYRQLHASLKKHHLNLSWAKHYNTTTNYIEEHLFTGEAPKRSVFHGVLSSQHGKNWASKIRRRLRVIAEEEQE